MINGGLTVLPMALLDSDEHQALLDAVPTMVWRAGVDGRCDCFNAAWLGFTGRSLEQELGLGWLEGVHPEEVGEIRDVFRAHLAERQPFGLTLRLRRSDGVYRAVGLDGAPYSVAGAVRGFVGSCTDVRDHRRVDTSPSESDFFWMSLDNLCVAGFDGYFKLVNQSWTRTLGWTEEELMSKPSVEFVHPDDRAATLAGRGRLKGGHQLGPLVNRYLCKDGSHRWFEWRSVGHPERGLVYAAARDITEQKLAEQRLAEAQALQEQLQRRLIFADRMASVGTMAAGVAHELNNPLSYVSGNIAMMLEELDRLEGELAESRRADLKDMALQAEAGAERIRKIVLGVKTFSRADEERRSVVEIQPILELAIDMAFHEIRHRAQLVREYGATPRVNADEARLGQVFINLLVNAAQALSAGGAGARIRVVTRTDPNGRAVVEVHDTGRGIPAEARDRIFDPFFTTKPVGVGTGLGLSICHTIVQGLGGDISVESTEGHGALFRVVLPAAVGEPSGAATAPQCPHSPAMCAAVLVVDDEPAIGAILQRALRGHEVAAVARASEALTLLREGRQFDVIFSDLIMPEMSGMDFFDALTHHHPDAVARVVFITGGASTPAAKAFLDRVSNGVLMKPLDLKRVRELVQQRIEG